MKPIIEDCDYFLHFIPLPGSVGGVITPNDDNTYSIYLNSNHTPEMLLDDYTHEILHIMDDDLYSEKPIAEIEGKSA